MKQRMQYAHPWVPREPADAQRYHFRKVRGEWVRVAWWPLYRSKYQPHQGAREMARRVKQMGAA